MTPQKILHSDAGGIRMRYTKIDFVFSSFKSDILQNNTNQMVFK